MTLREFLDGLGIASLDEGCIMAYRSSDGVFLADPIGYFGCAESEIIVEAIEPECDPERVWLHV